LRLIINKILLSFFEVGKKFAPGSKKKPNNLDHQYQVFKPNEVTLEYFSSDLVEYMNKNIKAPVLATFRAQHGLISNNIEVKSLETDGYYICQTENLFSTFSKRCETIHDFRNELLIHVRNYRKFIL